MTPVRIIVAGAGLIGRRHIDLVGQSERCELVVVADPSSGAARLAADLGVAWHPSLPEALGGQDRDGLGVIVATPNRLHVEHGLTCVEAGVPVLVEKPIGYTLEDSERLVSAAEAAGVSVLVGHHRRHSPLLATARRLVTDGTLGGLVAVQGSALFHKPDDYFAAAPWRREPGGGPVLINMVHEVDDLRFLCGEITAVQAMATNRTRGFPVEDTLAITLQFTGGALGTFLLSDTAASARSWEQTSGENPSYPRYPDEDCYLLAGTRGSLAVPSMRLRTYPGHRSWWEPFESTVVAVEPADPLARQLDHFCDVVHGNAPPLVDGRDALETLRVTLAIAAAARTTGVVTVRG